MTQVILLLQHRSGHGLAGNAYACIYCHKIATIKGLCLTWTILGAIVEIHTTNLPQEHAQIRLKCGYV